MTIARRFNAGFEVRMA